MPSSPVAVVTDSTAYLPPGAAERHGVHVVPLEVRLGERTAQDGIDVTPAELITALADRDLLVQTSRPAPASFARMFRELLDDGAEEIVSVHLSRELSGTWDAARAAAQEVDPERIRVVDSRAIAMGLGFAVLAACDAAASGARGVAVAAAAGAVAARCRVLFGVQDLERLRRGGRIGAASALLGGVLAIKPLLHLSEGRIAPLEKVRTTTRATERLVALAVAEAGGPGARLAVHHLGAEERAEDIADRLREQLPDAAELHVSEVGAVIGAHVGPGLVGVVVVPAGT
ncbi:EDD domain protein, DegV family [Pseudonocardia ammonioxydans]|uniref:EDD domain protein, DegV family n=1 Tax=Pseudonocardia ammonioxydans TaxID=260086 RepID=A0A1I5GFJ9_PSUAM|nr:DegV family protein [Pseudonocardia ammonioxydans]SFO34710.1 EDD domain protein, DegV family [Pseudonocardia ammonioxydans]